MGEKREESIFRLLPPNLNFSRFLLTQRKVDVFSQFARVSVKQSDFLVSNRNGRRKFSSLPNSFPCQRKESYKIRLGSIYKYALIIFSRKPTNMVISHWQADQLFAEAEGNDDGDAEDDASQK